MDEFDTIKVCPDPKELSEIVNKISCQECGSVFANSARLTMHLKMTHDGGRLAKKTGNFQYYCPAVKCKYALVENREPTLNRFFTKLKYLKQHYQNVHLEKSYVCEKCRKCFVSEHVKQVHLERECQIEFSCFTCLKTYSTRVALLTHCKRFGHAVISPYKTKIKEKITLMTKSRRIVPKSQDNMPMEDIAAAALSELSWKVVVRKGVDIGVQTDHRSCSRKRTRRDTKTQTQRIAATSTNSTQTEKHDLMALEQNILTDIVYPPQGHLTSSTQTSSDKFMIDLGMFPDIDQQVNNHTQTELMNQQLILDEESPIILSDTQTQTMDLDDYSHNFTQTCQDIFLNDFVELSDIETQTAWACLTMDPCLVTAQTQTLF